MAQKYRKGQILIEVLKLLKAHPDGLKPKEIFGILSQKMELSEYEKGVYASGMPRFIQIVRFSTIDAVKAGFIIKNGDWIITDAGLEALKTFPTPEQMQKGVMKLYNQWRKNRLQHSSGEDESEEDDLAANVSITYEQAQEQAQESIDDYLQKMNPFDFQNLVADLLNALGYYVNWISPPGKDGGTDIIAYTDPLGIQGPRIKVQVKRQQATISEPELKSFMANIGPHDSGIYVCTGGFTQDAQKYARQQENRRILLVDSKTLVQLWTTNMKKLSDQSWQRLPLTPIYFLAPGN